MTASPVGGVPEPLVPGWHCAADRSPGACVVRHLCARRLVHTFQHRVQTRFPIGASCWSRVDTTDGSRALPM